MRNIQLIFFFLITLNSFGQFTRFYYSNADSAGYLVKNIDTTSDGGYILAGDVSDTLIYGSALCMKLDSAGVPEWTKAFSTNWSEGYDVLETNDQGYILVGMSTSLNTYEDILLVKTNAVGDTLWTRTLGSTGTDIPCAIFQTADNGYLVAGTTDGFGSGHLDLMLIKTDSSGNPLWAHYYGTLDTLNSMPSDEELRDIIETPTGYLLAGWIRYSFIALLIEVDFSGNILWSNNFDSQAIKSICTASDGYLIKSGGDIHKIDWTGNLQWTQYFGSSRVIQSADGDLVFIDLNGIAKTDSIGNPKWNYKIHDNGQPISDFNLILPLQNDQYLISGTIGISAFSIIKTDSSGNSSCFENDTTYFFPGFQAPNYTIPILESFTLPSVWNYPVSVSDVNFLVSDCTWLQVNASHQISEFYIFPNPAHNQFQIIKSDFESKSTVEIFNLVGKKIYSCAFREQITVNCELFPKGIYIVRLFNSEKQFTQKLVIE
jgi:hypothetical protein